MARSRIPEMVPFQSFAGGLNLRDQPNQIDPSQAIDLLNVTFTDRGGIRNRDGYAKFTASALTNVPDSLAAFYTTSGTQQLVVGNGNRLDAVNTAGSSIANAAPTANPHYMARFGGPTAELMFISNGTDALRQWNGTAFSTPAWTGTTPTGKFVAVTAWDNRLVNARRSGAALGDNVSTVAFSDPGVPTTWTAANTVDLTPGDGEQIMGMVAWSRYLFVFKETKFFRFYGTSTGGGGTPVFNFEAIDNGVGLAASRAVCAGRDGVYFLSQRGVYRTTGSTAEPVSPLLDPFFYGNTPDFYTGGVLNQGAIDKAAMAAHREQIYLAVPTGAATANNRMLVFDPRYNWWSLYDIPAAALASFKVSDQPDLLFAYASGTKDLGRHTLGQLTDAGTTIGSRWRSGWTDFQTTHMKTILSNLLWGKGRVRVGARADFGATSNSGSVDFNASTDKWADGTNAADKWADGTNSADKWGAGTLLIPKLNRAAIRGSVFSFELFNTDASAWAVYRLENRVSVDASARSY